MDPLSSLSLAPPHQAEELSSLSLAQHKQEDLPSISLRPMTKQGTDLSGISLAPQLKQDDLSSLSPLRPTTKQEIELSSSFPLSKLPKEDRLRCAAPHDSKDKTIQPSPWAAYNKRFNSASLLGEVMPAKSGGQMGEALAKPGGQLSEASNGGQPKDIIVEATGQPVQNRRRGRMPKIKSVLTKW